MSSAGLAKMKSWAKFFYVKRPDGLGTKATIEFRRSVSVRKIGGIKRSDRHAAFSHYGWPHIPVSINRNVQGLLSCPHTESRLMRTNHGKSILFSIHIPIDHERCCLDRLHIHGLFSKPPPPYVKEGRFALFALYPHIPILSIVSGLA